MDPVLRACRLLYTYCSVTNTIQDSNQRRNSENILDEQYGQDGVLENKGFIDRSKWSRITQGQQLQNQYRISSLLSLSLSLFFCLSIYLFLSFLFTQICNTSRTIYQLYAVHNCNWILVYSYLVKLQK